MATEQRPNNTIRDREIVKESREIYDISQGELADDAGISESKLSLYENGFVDLTDAELKKLGKALMAQIKANLDMRRMPGFTDLNDPEYLEKSAAKNKEQIIKGRRSMRRRARLTVIALAGKIGIPEKKLRAWEKDRVKLTDEERKKWEEALIAARVERKLADPWTRPHFMVRTLLAERDTLLAERRDFLTRLQNLSSIDDPVIAEVIESFRREIAELEQQAKRPVESETEGN
jgi:DNA-binding transcriptional regulator YiaG